TREIEVKNGTARLLNGTLSGTTLPLLVGVQNLVKWGICDAEEAIALATVAPREAIGINGIIGKPASQLLHWQMTQAEGNGEAILTWKRIFPSCEDV
ncbi:N-acetylglucosamine-6-phosphate deacetylase, partial [Planktothrix sp. FACHB-1355]|nr:N-acetylglucosamine-6-phosphate deacetylase [Planktothrix sp. FACHB-1355]